MPRGKERECARCGCRFGKHKPICAECKTCPKFFAPEAGKQPRRVKAIRKSSAAREAHVWRKLNNLKGRP